MILAIIQSNTYPTMGFDKVRAWNQKTYIDITKY